MKIAALSISIGLTLVGAACAEAPKSADHATTASTKAQSDELRKIISVGEAAGDYQAFPDMCRLQNGDLMAVFYAGDSHVTGISEKYPLAGRVCMTRSSDEGKTWSAPVVIFDDEFDNRDPHINQMKDGTLVCSFFSLKFPDPKSKKFVLGRGGPDIIRSFDNGKTWEKKPTALKTDEENFYSSSQVKETSSGRWVLPVYGRKKESPDFSHGGVTFSDDRGGTWTRVIPIGLGSKKDLAAETDFIVLKDGTWLAALRGQQETPLQFAKSHDEGMTWDPVEPSNFIGHAPSFTRLKSGAILLNTRGFKKGNDWKTGYTALRVSYDEGKTWQGPYEVAPKVGAYSATVELKDGTVAAIYYDESAGSKIRVVRFNVPKNNGETFPVPEPKPLELLPWK